MGYVLYTASGTFNPASYGLTAGDTVQVVCVGGGASGTVLRGITNKAGSASSFGSYATAPGANAHIIASSKLTYGALVTGGRIGISNDVHCRGSMGAPGWLPDIGYVPMPNAVYGFAPNDKMTVIDYSASKGPYDYAPYSAGINALNRRGVGYAGCGQLQANVRSDSTGMFQFYYLLFTHRPGGMGFGAGGGGTYFSNDFYSTGTLYDTSAGGNSGGVVEATVTLSSSAAIAVTVGSGGDSVTTTINSYPMYSGEGADGCVAVFW